MPAVYDRLKHRNHHGTIQWLRAICGGARQLSKYIKTYPVYQPPHPGKSTGLSPPQTLENFRYFNQEKHHRLEIISETLKAFDLTIDYRMPSYHQLMLLDAWAYQQWPSVYYSQLVMSNVYCFDVEQPLKAMRSLLFDISLLLGEAYISLEENASWCMDSSPEAREKQLPSYNRLVIQRSADDGIPIMDIEAQVFFHYGLQINKNTALILADQKTGRVLAEPLLHLLTEPEGS
jgi:hypothetical protein